MSREAASIRAVIGTAGHVDHGKTTLVQHLTGIDTDRLAEEKQRGISIELGFAWLDTPGGRLAIIDVPGHERFVRQMIAGAAGIDLVLLVVAADEGVMPQTLEHLDICQLLGVSGGAVVITKTDLVDEEWLELVREDVADHVAGTFLEGAPVLTYAAGDAQARLDTIAGIEALVEAAAVEGRLASRSADRPLKLSIDRSFHIRGFGTVVTGTTASGVLAAGDSVVLLPGGAQGRVRGLQVHEESVARVGPGSRAAVNIQGLDTGDVSRGAVLTHPGALRLTSMIDCTFRALKRLPKPLEDRARVLVHIGTAQVEGTLAFLGRYLLAPGESTPAQLRLDSPIAILPGEPFVARGFTTLESYGTTIGGGVALMPQRRRHRRTSEAGLALVEALAGGDPRQMVEAAIAFEGDLGLAVSDLHPSLPLERATADAAVAEGLAAGTLVRAGDRLYGAASADRLGAAALETVAAYHAANPAWPGIRPEELRTRVRAELPQDYFTALLERLVQRGELARRGDVLAQPGFTPRRSPRQEQVCAAILAALEEGGLTPPRVQDLPELLRLPAPEITDALELLHHGGEAVRVSKDLSYGAGPLAQLREELVAYLSEQPAIDTAAFKEMTGASRKWTIPLGEYFDRIRLTIRVGDQRRLRS